MHAEELRFTDELDDFDRVWRLPDLADVTITDQRLLFICARWDIGGGWFSFGSPVSSALLNLASRARAAARRRGVVMVGQVRWQWPSLMQVTPGSSHSAARRQTSAQPASLLLLTKAFRTAGRPALRLSGGEVVDPAIARQLGALVFHAIVRFRLERRTALGVDEASTRRLRELQIAGWSGAGDVPQQANLPGPLLLWFLADDEYRSAEAENIAAGKAG